MNWPACSNRRYSPPHEEGWLRHQQNFAKPTLAPQTGWSLTSHCSRMHSAIWFVSDHSVRSIKGGFAPFLDVAATPPHEEGNSAYTDTSSICSQLRRGGESLLRCRIRQ